MAAAANPFASLPTELEWKFTQVFEDKSLNEEATEADIISAVEFDQSGNFLAIGDRGGRVVIIRRMPVGRPGVGPSRSPGGDYKLYTEFQSHEPEFDCLKSLEIEEKINQIRFCPKQNSALYLLTTNDKTIKLWKVQERKVKRVASLNLPQPAAGARTPPALPVRELRVPSLIPERSVVAATPRRVYANAHAYLINSISINSDGESFLSADDLRINLWNMNTAQEGFNIVDLKPPNIEELAEVITCSSFHPSQCHTFVYSTSRGSIKLGDMRQNSLCDQYSKLFEPSEGSSSNFFAELISSVNDVKFSKCGNYMLSRDYLTLKVWDINMEREPLQTIHVHDHLRQHLCDLYENDFIFDKFECVFSGDSKFMMTGSYHNMFYVYDWEGRTHSTIEASKAAPKRRQSVKGKAKSPVAKRPPAYENMDLNKKVLRMNWHPTDYLVAVASLNNLYIYDASGPNPPSLTINAQANAAAASAASPAGGASGST